MNSSVTHSLLNGNIGIATAADKIATEINKHDEKQIVCTEFVIVCPVFSNIHPCILWINAFCLPAADFTWFSS